MVLGHYAVAFAAKRLAPRSSLGVLVLAAQWVDNLWPIFLLLGVEHVRIQPGRMAASPLDFYDYPYTHSLVAGLAWAVLLGGVYWLVRRRGRAALVVGALVVSHWLLDLVVHEPDLPLWPGGGPKLGLGLWNSVPATYAVELALFVVGAVIYARTTEARDAIGRWGFYALAGVLVAGYVASSAGPPPSDVKSLAEAALALWLFPVWAWWVDRHRAPRLHGVGGMTQGDGRGAVMVRDGDTP